MIKSCITHLLEVSLSRICKSSRTFELSSFFIKDQLDAYPVSKSNASDYNSQITSMVTTQCQPRIFLGLLPNKGSPQIMGTWNPSKLLMFIGFSMRFMGCRMRIHTKSLFFPWDSWGSGWEFIQNHWFFLDIHGIQDDNSYKISGFAMRFMGFRMIIHTKSLVLPCIDHLQGPERAAASWPQMPCQHSWAPSRWFTKAARAPSFGSCSPLSGGMPSFWPLWPVCVLGRTCNHSDASKALDGDWGGASPPAWIVTRMNDLTEALEYLLKAKASNC